MQAAQHRAADAEDALAAAEQAADAARAEQRGALAGSAGPPAEGSEAGGHMLFPDRGIALRILFALDLPAST